MRTINDFCWWLKRCAVMLRRKDGKFMLAQERRLANEARRALKVQSDFCVKMLDKLPSLLLTNSIERNSMLDDGYMDDQLRFLPVSKLTEAIIAKAKPTLLKGGKETVKNLKLAEFGISFSLQHADAIKYIASKRTLLLSDYKGTISYTTKSRIKDIINEGVSRGASYSELATAIRQQEDKGIFSRARAEFISSHELGEAYNQGQRIPADEFSAKYPDRQMEKMWLTVGDEAVTEECQANGEEGWINYNEDFSSGDFSPPRVDHPRCRCSWTQRIL